MVCVTVKSVGVDSRSQVYLYRVIVERDISALPTRDDQLSQIVLNRSTYQWMILKDIDCLNDQACRLLGLVLLPFEKKICHPLEIIRRASRMDQSRQCLSCGLAEDLPCRRARMCP